MKKISLVLIACCAFALTGCGLLFGGGSSQTVDLVPSDGKKHSVSVQIHGKDPYDIEIPKKISVKRSIYHIRVVVKDSADGKIEPTTIKAKANPVSYVSVHPISSCIDAYTNAAWKYDESVTINVTKKDVEAAARAEEAEKKAKEARKKEAREKEEREETERQ